MATEEKYHLNSVEDLPLVNLGKFILDCMREHDPQTVALVEGETGQSYTYKQLIEFVEQAAAGLQKFGVKKDDVICVLAPNNIDYMVAFYGSALLYAVLQPVNPLYTKDDIKRVTEECKTKYLITIPAFLPKVKEALGEDSEIKVITFGEADGYTSFSSLLDPSNVSYTTPEGDPKTCIAALMSSSGTTGFPKAVQISHYNMVSNTIQQRSAKITDASDNFVVFLPLFHAYGLYIITVTVHSIGGKIVLMSKFQPDMYLDLIQKHKPRFLHVVPPIMVMFAKYPKVSEYDLSSVQTIVCGAAPLSKEIESAVKAKLNISNIFQGYGMTEVGVTHLCSNEDFRYKSVGRLLPLVEMKIMNVDTQEECKSNEEGEIWIKGPQVCLGYLNKPEQNAEMFTEDGWTKTGDIGYEDENGFLYIVDRLKELIKYKAMQVAPATLEDILLKHEAVADVGVVGMPDEEAGELPRAYVVKKAGKDITEEELINFVAGQVAPHMKLRGGVEFVNEIQRTASGKILRRTLREKARELAASKNSESMTQ
ncbi:hypothetical protein ACF0H5_004016 [Mactra antiquata]